ncbi:LAO/AO transport system kinase [Meinhardsimonia xiamenensis]|jgi:LAO/AO transport system kinase|uniref:LAO/AO transport system kinase n=1 Tax=Meinhardsimonia xiamenensis TaxID=990712 RepID=A0A1G8ZC10_9RHOB|nr:methylmalonyl Co-A mutase-associated GTPase MeaB [Meinhardsimonia xiamenensis]PRX37639.1 LAO/AO transport system kinase [Meinhardsimonia xiamenensis]SDK12548.1 LAO/AO transport system kinase [Meinhardsimonia xiamenensis]
MSPSRTPDPQALAKAVLAGDRRALARAVTLVESTRSDHRKAALALLEALRGRGGESLRIGLSGTPGVGKSTFIEAFGLHLVEQGLKVAVLAVDPSSARTGGSILGDKTRMERLSRAPQAFIRPSPSLGALGGVARRTREAAAIVEAAGFDVVLIETVGVGQSETMVADLTDIFVLLMAPAGGDELQGVKRGIMEAADLILVNKADGDLAAAAERTRADYAAALRLMRPRPGDPEGWPKVMCVSALTGHGIAEAWAAISELADARRASGAFAARRAEQAQRWFEDELHRGLLERLTGDPRLGQAIAALEADLAAGRIAPSVAAERVIESLFGEGEGAARRP